MYAKSVLYNFWGGGNYNKLGVYATYSDKEDL